jgi:hypothetical protein
MINPVSSLELSSTARACNREGLKINTKTKNICNSNKIITINSIG